jgi:hypothetical protein
MLLVVLVVKLTVTSSSFSYVSLAVHLWVLSRARLAGGVPLIPRLHKASYPQLPVGPASTSVLKLKN